MNNERLDPQKAAWGTVQYEEDPFELGDIDETKLVEVSKGFLPSPEELVFKEPKPKARKVTILLDDFTVQAFKEKAEELGGSYQAMMRKLLLNYAHTLKNDDKNLNP